MSAKLPSIVIVGLPNVGKSTLFNRLTGSRRSIVTDEPGITRDRIYGTGHWRGRQFEVVDTGGLLPDDQAEIPREIFRQARLALDDAAQIVLVTDARAGLAPLDAELARLLRRTGKPIVVAANRVDTQTQTAQAAAFHELGLDVFPVSAEHGLGVDDLLDAITASFSAGEAAAAEEIVQVAIIGRPNVGKSTLLNRLVGAERAIVSAVPGTTRDAVDTLVRHNGRQYRFIDTAGIRRKGKTKLFAEKLSVMMARRHLERADVALLVLDAAQGVSAQDATIAGYAAESGRSVILLMNKWDLALGAARAKALRDAQSASGKKAAAGKPACGKNGKRDARFEREPTSKAPSGGAARGAIVDPGQLLRDYEPLVRARLKFLEYAPLLFVSALTGERVAELYALIDRVAQARRRRVSTGELNRWLRDLDAGRGSSPAGRQVKILYLTQASVAPPTLVLFTNQARRMHFSFRRYLENRLRESFDFTGTPLRFLLRSRKK